MRVKLIAHTDNPDKVVSMAAKLCYSPVGAESIGEGLSPQEVEKFLGILVSMGHESPIEHVSFTFSIEGISRACSHQVVRHRIASFSQQSQRYVKLSQFEYIVPPQIEANEDAKAIFLKAMEADQKAYDEIVEKLYEKNYVEFINQGMSEKKAASAAEKVSIEDARYVFPNACETKMVVSMNARSLMNFFTHRCCERAQWEIRDLAFEMLREVKSVAPILFKNAGPSCYKGSCKEGAMSCKRPDIPKSKIEAIEASL